MNVFTLLTNWCSSNSKPVLTREEVGVASDFTSRSSRLDLHLSRLCLASLICLCMLTVGSGNVWGAEAVVYTLNTDTTGGSNGYATLSEDISITNHDKKIVWNAVGNTTLSPWRIGGKSLSNEVRVIYSETAISNNVTKVIVSHGGASSITANVTLNVYSTAAAAAAGGTTNRISSVSGGTVSENGTKTFTRPDGHDWSGRYYRFEYSCTVSGDKNKFLEFSQAEFYADVSSCEKIGAPSVTATPGDRQISLSWPNQAEASSYTVTCPGGSVGAVTGTTTKSCTITGLTNGTSYTWTVTPVGDGSTYCTDGNTAASASATPNVYYTVTWMNNGSSYTTTSVESGQKPTFPDNPSSCDGTSTTFVGWTPTPWSGKLDDVSAKTIYTSGSAMPNVSGPVTYHAVFAKTTGSGTTTQAATIVYSPYSFSGTGWATTATAGYSGNYLKFDTDGKNVTFTSPSGAISRFQFTYKLNPSTSCTGHSSVQWWIGDVKFYVSTDGGSNWSELTTKSINNINTGDGLNSDVAKDYTDLSSGGYNAIKVQLSKDCGNLGIKGLSATYSNVTYSEYLTSCCTALGSINGSVKVISGTGMTLQWDDISNVSSWAVTGVDVTNSNTAVPAGDIGTPTDKGSTYECAISNLTAGHQYKFTIAATAASGYCDKTQDVTVTTPLITLSETGLSGMSYIEGYGPSTQTKTFTITAVGLTGNLTVTAPTNFQVSTDNSSWGSSKTISHSSGSASGTVYVRLASGLFEGSYGSASTYVTVSGGSATTKNVSVQGTVSPACSDPTINTQPAASATYNLNVAATALSVSATKNGTGPALTYQWYSNTANSKTTPTPTAIGEATSASYTPPTTATGTKYYFCEVSSGACAVTTNISAITVSTPTITVSETSRAFGDRAKDGSYEMTFTVSGSTLAKDAGISLAISGTNKSLFSIDKTSLSAIDNAVTTTTITVTYSPDATGSHSAQIDITSTGATTKTVTLSGTSKNAATVKLHVAGSTSTISGTRYEGDSYSLPSTATECPDMGLYGWYIGEDYEHATTAPTGANFKLPGASATLEAGDNDFYAVYATVTPDAANTYTKITSTDDLVTGDYLIVGDYASSMRYAMKNSIYNTSYFGETSVTISDNKINSNPGTDYIWRITRSNTNVTIKNGSDYAAVSSGSAVLSATVENYTFSVTDGVWALTSGSYLLGYGYNFGARSSADKNIYLFKRDPSIAGPYTTSPSCTTHTLTVNMDPVAPDGCSASAVKAVLGETKTTTATATAGDHYVFSYWTISGTGSTMSNTSDGKSTDNPVTITMGTDDATLTAHFTEKEKCTVVFKNNGTQLSSTTYWRGENPVAPTLTDGTDHDACDETSDTHYGWTQTAWQNTLEQAAIDAKTAADVKVYAKDATLPAITAGDDGTTITYHAVWAEGSGGTTTISIDGSGLQAVVSSISSGYQSKDFTVGGYTFNASAATKCTDSGTAQYWFQLKKNNDAITIPTLPGKITNISSTAIRTASSGSVSTGVYFNSSATTSAAIASETLSGATSFSLDVTGNNTSGYLLFGAATCINQLSVTYSTASYSKYLTTCCEYIVDAPTVTGTPTKNSITLSWTNVANATGYTVTSSGGTPGDVTSDGTARLCVITGLSPNTNYTWSVVATYTTPYCLANTANGNTTTSQVYTVSYNKNGGTIANLPSGGTYAAGEEVTVATKPDGTVSKGGYTFTGWNTANDGSGEHYDADGSTSFTMPSETVVLYAEWTAKKNYFIDRMHGNWDGEHTEPTTGYNCYVREGAGYTVPDLSDDATGSNSCVTGHAHFVGWVASGNIDTQGGLKSGYTIIKGGTSGTASVDGTIYYAVWAEE